MGQRNLVTSQLQLQLQLAGLEDCSLQYELFVLPAGRGRGGDDTQDLVCLPAPVRLRTHQTPTCHGTWGHIVGRVALGAAQSGVTFTSTSSRMSSALTPSGRPQKSSCKCSFAASCDMP